MIDAVDASVIGVIRYTCLVGSNEDGSTMREGFRRRFFHQTVLIEKSNAERSRGALVANKQKDLSGDLSHTRIIDGKHISGMNRLFWTIRSWPSLKLMNEDCGNPVAIHFGKRCLSHGERRSERKRDALRKGVLAATECKKVSEMPTSDRHRFLLSIVAG
jgi:hypothetical protein